MTLRPPSSDEVRKAVDSLASGSDRESRNDHLGMLRSVTRASPEVLQELLSGLSGEADADARLACALAIGRCGDGAQSVIPDIRALLIPTPQVEKPIAMALVLTVANLHCAEAISLYREILNGQDLALKFIALQCLRSPRAFRAPLRDDVQKMCRDEILGAIATSLLHDAL